MSRVQRVILGLWAIGYTAVGLNTFGVAAVEQRKADWFRYRLCVEAIRVDREAGMGTPDRCEPPVGTAAAVRALAIGALWPFYWTWVAAEGKR